MTLLAEVRDTFTNAASSTRTTFLLSSTGFADAALACTKRVENLLGRLPADDAVPAAWDDVSLDTHFRPYLKEVREVLAALKPILESDGATVYDSVEYMRVRFASDAARTRLQKLHGTKPLESHFEAIGSGIRGENHLVKYLWLGTPNFPDALHAALRCFVTGATFDLKISQALGVFSKVKTLLEKRGAGGGRQNVGLPLHGGKEFYLKQFRGNEKGELIAISGGASAYTAPYDTLVRWRVDSLAFVTQVEQSPDPEGDFGLTHDELHDIFAATLDNWKHVSYSMFTTGFVSKKGFEGGWLRSWMTRSCHFVSTELASQVLSGLPVGFQIVAPAAFKSYEDYFSKKKRKQI